jgi:hypothetical protein
MNNASAESSYTDLSPISIALLCFAFESSEREDTNDYALLD